MYHYGFLPLEYLYSGGQPLPYAYLPVGPGSVTLPSIQAHNFCSRPLTLVSRERPGGRDLVTSPVEYHHFYCVNPCYPPQALRPWPQGGPVPLYPPWASGGPGQYRFPGHPQPSQSRGTWPEGTTLRGELRWGRLDRVLGPRMDLPEFVKADLRRVYGTYPRTDVSVTFQGGEFLVKGEPRVGEQEYSMEKRVVRRQQTPTTSEGGDGGSSSSEVQGRKKKKKSKH